MEETYNHRRSTILSTVVVSRGLIKTLTANFDKHPDDLIRGIIEREQQYIKDMLAELTELERWRVREGLGKYEKYTYGRE